MRSQTVLAPRHAEESEREQNAAPTARPRIVLVDDNDLFRESLTLNLTEAGFDVHPVASGEAAVAHLIKKSGDDVVLLDWVMPGMNGIEVLQRIRAANLAVPIILLTGLSDQVYEEAALQSGAVDFVEKSRSFTILCRRIELIVKGAKAETPDTATPSDGTILRRGDLELRRDTARAFWRGQEVPLSFTEFKIVDLLASHAGEDLRYRELYDLVHGEGFVTGKGPEGYRANIRAFIKRIREKFRAVEPGWSALENYSRFGYRWRAESPDP